MKPCRALARTSEAWCAIAWLLVWGAVPVARAEQTAVAETSVRVESNEVVCPSAEQVKLALGQVGVSAAPASAGWVLSYGTFPASAATLQAPFVWMDLANPAGQLVARRTFPNDGGDCGTIASAMSAVMELSLHELGWTRGEPLPQSPRPSQPETTPGRAAKPPRLILGAGPAVGTSAGVTSAALGSNLILEARVQVAGPVSFRLGGSLLSDETSQVVGAGKARMTSRHLSAAVLATLTKGKVHWNAGAVWLVSIDQGRTENLPEMADGRRAFLAMGIVLGADFRLAPRWRLALDILGLRTVAGADFVVDLDGSRRTVLAPPAWQGMACAKLEFVAWP